MLPFKDPPRHRLAASGTPTMSTMLNCAGVVVQDERLIRCCRKGMTLP